MAEIIWSLWNLTALITLNEFYYSEAKSVIVLCLP